MATPAKHVVRVPTLPVVTPVPTTEVQFGMGWLPDYPDIRDLTITSEAVPTRIAQISEQHKKSSINALLARVGVTPLVRPLPPMIDLRAWCSPIENQLTLGSCTANAGVGAVEYFERRAFGRYINASRLFLYKVTRKLMHVTGDTGAYLRITAGALTLFGVPPEEYEPYNIANFDQEPDPFCYAFAQNYQALQYYRLDPPGIERDALLNQIKLHLAAGLPSIFGFTVYPSYRQAETNGGKIPFPAPGESSIAGHAVMAVGYDNNMTIKNASPGSLETTGAFLIRNSWGTNWGDQGCGYLPYDYVLKAQAVDWWSLIKLEWVDTGKFGLGA